MITTRDDLVGLVIVVAYRGVAWVRGKLSPQQNAAARTEAGEGRTASVAPSSPQFDGSPRIAPVEPLAQPAGSQCGKRVPGELHAGRRAATAPMEKKAEALVRRVLRSRSNQEARFAVLRKGNSLEAIC